MGAAAGGMIAGGVLQGIGSIVGGFQAKDAYYRQAADIENAGLRQARALRISAIQVIGSYRLSVAKSGVEESGTVMELISYNAGVFDAEAIQVRRQTLRQANELRRSGRFAETAGILSGIASAASGGSAGAASLSQAGRASPTRSGQTRQSSFLASRGQNIFREFQSESNVRRNTFTPAGFFRS